MAVAGGKLEGFQRRVDDAVLVLFALVSEAVGWATTALLDQDIERANRVIADDPAIDERCEELAALVKERLGGPPPLAPEELEDLVAILQIVPELERSADLAEHIAQRALRSLGGTITPRSRGLIQRMSDVAIGMWKTAGNAYRQRSRDASFGLKEADKELDELAGSLVGEGLAPGSHAQVTVDLALIARFYERLGDHAVNLASRVETMGKPRRLAASRLLSVSRRSAAPSVPGEKQGLLRRMLHSLSRLRMVPTDEGFFDLFRAAAENCRDGAETLAKLIASFGDPAEQYERMKSYEQRGDQINVDVLRRLDASFVTPYDREDIHKLAEELDDVVDDMLSAASLITLVQEDELFPELDELAETLVSMADELVSLIGCLPGREGARLRLERIERLERQGDAVFRRGMARLFSGDYDALAVIKWKDIIQALENSLNAIEDASNVVEGILVKNS
jgi:predicted phosphate transport protein (TIGR00153 family)